MNTLQLDRPRPVGASRNGWIEEDKDKAGNGAQVQAAAQDIWMLSLGSDLPPGKVARIPLLLFAPPLSLDLDQGMRTTVPICFKPSSLTLHHNTLQLSYYDLCHRSPSAIGMES